MLHIDENKITSEILRIAGGRIAVAMAICAAAGLLVGAVVF